MTDQIAFALLQLAADSFVTIDSCRILVGDYFLMYPDDYNPDADPDALALLVWNDYLAMLAAHTDQPRVNEDTTYAFATDPAALLLRIIK